MSEVAYYAYKIQGQILVRGATPELAAAQLLMLTPGQQALAEKVMLDSKGNELLLG